MKTQSNGVVHEVIKFANGRHTFVCMLFEPGKFSAKNYELETVESVVTCLRCIGTVER